MKTSKCLKLLTASMCLLGVMKSAQGSQVKLDVEMSHPILEAGKKQITSMRVNMTGFSLKNVKRPPVNVALVIDKSGSMSGKKIQKAKEAAIMAIKRLSRQDIVSVIVYESTVRVLVPATKLTDPNSVINHIRNIRAGGSTALFAGVSKGGQEVKKFIKKNQVNRIILLSDGLANVGPSSPGELSKLGQSLGKEGISVTTIGLGLGYNEDLMVGLANASDGNHAFVEKAKDLAKIFKHEFSDILSVVAQEVKIKIKCAEGIRPVRVIGRTANIYGQNVELNMNQLYSNQSKYILLEVEVPASEHNQTHKIASVTLQYANMETKTQDKLTSNLSVRFSENKKDVREATNKEVMTAVVTQIANEENKRAVALRDKGKIQEAKKVLDANVKFIKRENRFLMSKKLRLQEEINADDKENIEKDGSWNSRRKGMKAKQYKYSNQQKF